MRRDGRRFVPEKLRLRNLAGSWLNDFPLPSGEDGRFLVINLDEERAVTIFQAREKSRQAVIIVLRPTPSGMAMAAGASQPGAQTEPGDLPGPAQRIAH